MLVCELFGYVPPQSPVRGQLQLTLSVSSLFQYAGRVTFPDKTPQSIALERLCTHRTHVIVYAKGYFEIFETLSFVRLVLGLSPPVQARLRQWLDEHLKHVEKRE
jgi:hypothetical protein